MGKNVRNEDGVALVVAILAMLLMAVLGAALVLNTSSETIAAHAFRGGAEGFYAADAVVEHVVDDLFTVPDWNAVIDGSVRSAFVDGPPGGIRALPDGSPLDLSQVVKRANSNSSATWRLYAYGPLNSILPGRVNSPYYVIAMAAGNPGPGPLLLRGEAFGPGGIHKIVEVIVGRSDTTGLERQQKYDLVAGGDSQIPGHGVRILSWREVR